MFKEIGKPRLAVLNRMALLTFLLGFYSFTAHAQAQAPATLAETPGAAAQAAPVQNGAPPQAAGDQQELHLLVGRSLVITSPTRIKRVSLADPTIAEAIVVTPNEVLLNGKAPGGVSLLLWDEAEQSQNFEVSVELDALGLAQRIHDSFPAETVRVDTANDVVMLSGKVSSSAVADKIVEVAKSVSPNVTSTMQIPPASSVEVLLEVKFAEVDRTKLNELGFNFLRNFGTNMPLSVSTQEYSPFGITQGTTTTASGTASSSINSNAFSISSLLNIAIFRPDINLAATIQALQENSVLQILAEPNLMTESGKQATFLAGGEFPYPVIQSTGAAGSLPAITIQFREYGVRLNFTPNVTPDGLIHLQVTPEVSDLDYSNALTISGFTIPALSTRRVQSDMELQDGQSFAIAGLVDNRDTEQFSKIPGIGDIPILGQLFKSHSVNKSKDELLVIVTPRVVHPLEAGTSPTLPVFPNTFLGPVTPAKQPAPASK
jgi:pilus assembly protein CpaC